ncbi:MAG: lipopolysaccharide heptosyltransferase II [Nitrospirota bacterium]|nr:lipopolysaccharide heptosyltransferase II [Nitrospirota bacterium]
MERILIIKLSAIGDVVQTLPALEAIKRALPDSRIDWVVEEAAAGILEGHPLIDRLLVSRRKTWFRLLKRPNTFLQGSRELKNFISELKKVRYDMAIDFQGLLKSGIVMGLARADRKIGYAGSREFSSLFLNERLPAYDIERHALERYLDIARYLGAVDPSSVCVLPIDLEKKLIRERLSIAVSKNERIVVLNPMARWQTKLWPEEKFSQLADRLISERRAAVIFTGSTNDREVIDRIMGMMKRRALNWAGDTTLKELAALASIADLFITTDTGPMHLAAAAGGRVLALFGPTAPWRTGPFGSGHKVVRKGLDCSPCYQRSCRIDGRCMTSLSVDDVMDHLPF